MAFNLSYNCQFQDLYTVDGIAKIHQAFQSFFHETEPDLFEQWSRHYNETLIVDVAKVIELFLTHLFNIHGPVQVLQAKHHDITPLFTARRLFVQRWAFKTYPEAKEFDGEALQQALDFRDELSFAKQVLDWMDEPSKYASELDLAARFAAWAVYHWTDSLLFHVPAKIQDLYRLEKKLPFEKQRLRNGFHLTDSGLSRSQAMAQAHYCIFCHHQGKDSCTKGLKAKNLDGCPLDQKISEMNELKSQGFNLAALAVITRDNPLVAATGHRICNDCMRACIYQKQEPVNIPGIETQILNDVLDLPWGFEIYSLLTRWMPLTPETPLPQDTSGYQVLVVGQGPAGFTLAHYLMNQGHQVLAIDGLKIEPLDIPFEPIHQIKDHFEDLDNRVNWGFGGVAEYGITVRWNKNYLKIIRLLLERRSQYALQGETRLGSTLTLEQSYAAGFDHVALCLGAGSPHRLNLPHQLAPGVRMASDFLMALQLSGASRPEVQSNLFLRMPIVVIGGGLTAIDTATEAKAYYIRQIQKISMNDKLSKNTHKDEFLGHAKQLDEGKSPQELIEVLGGVKIVYRRSFDQSPSFRLNPEEVKHALAEGIEIVDEAVPDEILLDSHGHVCGLSVNTPEGRQILNARTILVATGTQPNTSLAFDEDLPLDGIHFKAQDRFLIQDRLSYLGDLHPEFSGSVVKAMASAKAAAPLINQALRSKPAKAQNPCSQVQNDLKASIQATKRLNEQVLELTIHAPWAARNVKPGQFFRFQTFETQAFHMRGIPLTGAAVDVSKGLITLIVLLVGENSQRCLELKPGDPIALMGPTGAPTYIPKNKKALLVGAGLGNVVLFAIGKAMRDQGCHVTYVAGYRQASDRFRMDDIEKAADQVIWCAEDTCPTPRRPQDQSFQGNVLKPLETNLQLKDFDHLLVIGSEPLLKAFQDHLMICDVKPDFTAMAALLAPMQCMMKGICAQCLVRLVDPKTGQESFVYSCAEQDQDLRWVDLNFLKGRLEQVRS